VDPHGCLPGCPGTPSR